MGPIGTRRSGRLEEFIRRYSPIAAGLERPEAVRDFRRPPGSGTSSCLGPIRGRTATRRSRERAKAEQQAALQRAEDERRAKAAEAARQKAEQQKAEQQAALQRAEDDRRAKAAEAERQKAEQQAALQAKAAEAARQKAEQAVPTEPTDNHATPGSNPGDVAALESPPAPSPAKPSSAEARAWDRIKDSDNQAALQEFVKRYPKSPLVPNAQKRLDTVHQIAQEREDKARADREAAQQRADEERRAKAAEAERQKAEQQAALQRADEERRAQAADAGKQKAGSRPPCSAPTRSAAPRRPKPRNRRRPSSRPRSSAPTTSAAPRRPKQRSRRQSSRPPCSAPTRSAATRWPKPRSRRPSSKPPCSPPTRHRHRKNSLRKRRTFPRWHRTHPT